MVAKKSPPFVLPEHPIDKYEVKYYRVSLMSGSARVFEIRAVYHTNSKWEEVCPDMAKERGADFVNHWQFFTDGQFDGRSRDGWDVFSGGSWDDTFATRQEANEYAVAGLRKSVDYYKSKIADAEQQIARLT